MTPEEKSAWNRAYYQRNRQKYLDRSRDYYYSHRHESAEYAKRYYDSVTRHVRQDKPAKTPIKGAASRRTKDKHGKTTIAWSDGVPTQSGPTTITWS